MSHLLIAGIPGVGRSHFCGWLVVHRGYIHVETDLGTDRVAGLLLGGPPDQVVASAPTLMSYGPRVALECGFIPRLIDRVRAAIAEGFEPWWFGGNEAAARASNLAPGKPVVPLNVQLAAIHEWWRQIEAVFNGRILDAASMGAHGRPVHRPPEDSYAAMLDVMSP